MKQNRQEQASPRRKRRRRPGKFRRALRALGRAVLLLLLTAAAIVMMTVFFKVNTISVEGAEKYSAEEITTALDINKGDNLNPEHPVLVLEFSHAVAQRFFRCAARH